MVTVSYQIKALFFDRAAVIDREEKATRRVLSKAGSFIRRAARSSMRRRKKASAPGTPPSAHSTDPVATLKNILFAYEPDRRSVIVGPVGLNAKANLNGVLRAGVVPEVHEHGGTVRRVKLAPGVTGRRATPAQAAAFRRKVASGEIRTPPRQRIQHTARYPRRPYMEPAMRRELPKFPRLFANSIAA